ncbi:MAG: nucleotidyl transferase AbiEii/AbiGii toxin family protein [Novosphingobium sp.]|uniref:nucleotidyl transferase AbiEii/AbiGii toxin family protein n=1 Tax=Novosphingobium sp. TaxID=1874826 RepID=UPI00273344C3|nr:nucleotidyl transferase AbiEii/AbiGii toxin family protein [Novosphingobium sp.]MDP3549331.1 nucleotidyl transferase AbiEii/AbiGii toxin family protein [Novosphingobium sp.]
MSEHEDASVDVVDVDVRGWVDAARSDPQLHRDRQVTEIVLAAIGLAPTLKQSLVLKGGTLMAIAFHSARVTGDVDFTAMGPPDGFDILLREELDKALPQAAIRLGYLDLLCRVQGVKRRPRPELFEEADFPALEIRIGSAQRGSAQAELLAKGKAARTLLIEVSFRDQVYAFQELHLTHANIGVQAFTIEELIAEKLRALLQQPIRRRNRRQDVYDIAFLLRENHPSAEARAAILETLLEKCKSRGLLPNAASLDNPEVRERAQMEWETLRLELADLPPFDDTFAVVAEFYKLLPWPE